MVPRSCAFLLSVVAILVAADDSPITCGSILKLQNDAHSARLHSHDVKYGSGSSQQSVTGVKDSDDVNSHWQILPALKESCGRGVPVKCGQQIRLLHVQSGCHLHSHHFQAPLSKAMQEVSCFGSAAESDSGDHWTVTCDGDEWTETDSIKLKHSETGAYLATSGNQFGRPIHGQFEVVGTTSARSSSAMWHAAEGVYMGVKQTSSAGEF